MMQEFLVGLIVACAAWAVVARYAPKALTRGAGKLLASALKGMGLVRAADYLGNNLQGTSCADGCGSCGGCGPVKTPAKGAISTITPDALKRTAR
ncbi:MAG TPA: DUF6587 family protein [Noviherbaspirillum sp.]|nr:DUF6587 family protein [Noviherbaspirillum sp.]